MGSGTISGPKLNECGSLIELAGKSIILDNDEKRHFLHDGDQVSLSGICHGKGFTIGFGSCMGEIIPAFEDNLFY